jgi:CRP-like cAMP-binding protein
MENNSSQLMTTFPLFKGFTANGTQRLIDAGEITRQAPGDVLLREGDTAEFVLLVLTGKLEVFVQREGKDLILTEAGPGTILGELAVLCGIPRSASVRAKEASSTLRWSDDAFRALLIHDHSLSQRIFSGALRTLVDKERSLIDSLIAAQK